LKGRLGAPVAPVVTDKSKAEEFAKECKKAKNSARWSLQNLEAGFDRNSKKQ
jgi:hypothetical protein